MKIRSTDLSGEWCYDLKQRVNSTRDVVTTKVRKSIQFLDEGSFGRNLYSTCHLIVSRWHSLVATWFTLLNSSLTLWTCTKSQKDGQNYKNTGVRRAILPKCPSRRANPSLDGRLWHTAEVARGGEQVHRCQEILIVFCHLAPPPITGQTTNYLKLKICFCNQQ